MIRVLVIDDNDEVRSRVVQLQHEAADIAVLGEACNGSEALQALREHEYDVILLDISMPDISGFEVLKQLQDFKPEQRVLILSMHPEEQYSLRSKKAGARGYLTKDRVSDELIMAIRKVSRGGTYFTPLLDEVVLENSAGETEDETPMNL